MPLAYGIKKLQINAIIEDDKVILTKFFYNLQLKDAQGVLE